MKNYPAQSFPSFQKGVVLLEALIAVVLFSCGTLALVGLQAAMIKNTDDAKYRVEASIIAQQKISDMWIGGGNLVDYVVTDAVVPQLPGGKATVTVSASKEVAVIIKWTMPGGVEHNYLANARVEGLI